MNTLYRLIKNILKKNKWWKKFNISHLWFRIKEAHYFLICIVWYRYNNVRIKSLPVTWSDRDIILLHASFQILTDFIEKEKLGIKPILPDFVKTDYDAWIKSVIISNEKQTQLWDLYVWWNKKRKHDWDSLCLESAKTRFKKQQELEKKDDEMLAKLVSLRSYMWD